MRAPWPSTSHPKTSGAMEKKRWRHPRRFPSRAVVRNPGAARPLPVWPRPGGVHEFGAWWGLSLMSGHIWGYAKDVKYMPIDVRYTYLFTQHQDWTMRYAPEMTALAMLDEPVQGAKPTTAEPAAQYLRQRAYGSGSQPGGL